LTIERGYKQPAVEGSPTRGNVSNARHRLRRRAVHSDFQSFASGGTTPRVSFRCTIRTLSAAPNLTATKARLLLMACLMKFGSLPPTVDPDHPTSAEMAAVRQKVADYQGCSTRTELQSVNWNLNICAADANGRSVEWNEAGVPWRVKEAAGGPTPATKGRGANRRTRDRNKGTGGPNRVNKWPGVPNLERALEVSGTTLFQKQKPGHVKAQGVRPRRSVLSSGVGERGSPSPSLGSPRRLPSARPVAG
jgi:hypothetical protein